MAGAHDRAKLFISWLGYEREEEEGAGVPISASIPPMTGRLSTRPYLFNVPALPSGAIGWRPSLWGTLIQTIAELPPIETEKGIGAVNLGGRWRVQFGTCYARTILYPSGNQMQAVGLIW